LANFSRRYIPNPSDVQGDRADLQYPEYKDKITIVLKGGSTDVTKEMTWGVDRNREMIQHATELLGKKPEIYSVARLLPGSDFDEVFGGMKKLQDEGLFDAFGASEMKRESLERANKVGASSSPLFSCPSTTIRATYPSQSAKLII
jgi:aryl-alcohol dehydrogenase-like predicted oxidoreductase